jgi:hypothetical protein
MRAFRSLFFFLAAGSACFADNSVQRAVAIPARYATGTFAVLFVIAEFMELLSL